MSVLSSSAFDHHELVAFGHDKKSGLNAIIAIHDTQRGPSSGGCRMYPYMTSDQALFDVLRLSRGMTYKSAVAGLPFGGGKSVIIGDPRKDKNVRLLHAMGEFIDSLGGKYIVAEDSGTGVEDMLIIGEKTHYVTGVDSESPHKGDPSPSTALGVSIGIQASVRYKMGLDTLSGMRIAIQGVGHVGYHLTALLVKAGAKVFVADVSSECVARTVKDFGVTPVSPEDIFGIEVEVFAPCAMGAIINDDTLPLIKASIIAGAANNQLAEPRHADLLKERGVLYAPDFVVNAGGMIDVFYQQPNTDKDLMHDHIVGIGDTLMSIFKRADEEACSTHSIAERLAQEKLQQG